MKQPPVYKAIVLKNLCIGCGNCSAICPRGRLSMEWNGKGYYGVGVDEQLCPDECNMCLNVCPFANRSLNEDELSEELFGQIPNIKFKNEIGYFKNTYAGYSLRREQRLNGASGGMATWFLAELIQKNIVDHVVCVTADSSPNPLFSYTVCDSIEDIQLNAKSAYYPVHMSDVLKKLQMTEGRYAIVCLPCYAKAIRLASKINKKIARRIVCILGLVCGHGANKFFAEYATEKAGGRVEELKRIVFRTKDPSRPASDFGIDCFLRNHDGTIKQSRVFWSQGIGKMWNGFWFTPNPCLYCDDIFAETADIVFMDAWRSEFISDYRGTSLIAVRSELSARICNEGISSKAVSLRHYPVEHIIKSQASVVECKREGLSYRLWLANKKNYKVSIKRVSIRKTKGVLQRFIWRNQIRSVEIGPSLWLARNNINGFEAYVLNLNRLERALKKTKYILLQILNIPRRVIRFALR